MKPVEEAVTGFASTDQAPGLSGQEGETQTHGSVSPRRGGRLSAGSSSPCRALPRSVPGPSSPAYPTTASRAPSRWSTVGCSVSMGLGFPPASPSCELPSGSLRHKEGSGRSNNHCSHDPCYSSGCSSDQRGSSSNGGQRGGGNSGGQRGGRNGSSSGLHHHRSRSGGSNNHCSHDPYHGSSGGSSQRGGSSSS